MADRVHPTADPEDPTAPPKVFQTYVIKVPKDQIYRLPPPENSHLFESYSRRSSQSRRRRSCCRCIAWTLLALVLLLVLLAIAAAVLYLVFQPKIPSYSLDKLSISGLNLSAGPISPEFDLTLRADNSRNKKVGLRYEEGSDIGVYYSGDLWSSGVWPAFYQPGRNVTVIQTALKGSGIRLSSASRSSLVEQERRGGVPLEVDVKVDVRVKFGAVSSWKVTVKVRCEVVVDKMTPDLRLVSKDCRTKLHF